jgi:hypothetical protein
MKKAKKEYRAGIKFTVGNFLLLAPAAFYWVSGLMSVTLGIDYFFDVFFSELKRDPLGNVFFITVILIFPLTATAVNLKIYRRNRVNWLKWTILFAGAVAVSGFLALGRLFFAT